MSEKEFVEKSLTLSFEFQRYLIAHPKIADHVPKGAQFFFLLRGAPEFNKREKRMAANLKKEGQPIVFVKVEKVIPPFESRLVNPRIATVAA